MSSRSSQINSNIIEPLPRFFTLRFGRGIKLDSDHNDDDNKNDKTGNDHEQHFNEVIQQSKTSTNEDLSSLIVITGIRNRDWNFQDDVQSMKDNNMPTIKYQKIPSISNTIKNYSTNFMINNDGYQYEEYDLDEQDFQWLMAYNNFRIEKRLPELDENIFEYIIQLLEHQCLLAIRQQYYEDTIQCDACHRLDDVNDLIQCLQCHTIVHKKCYGIDDDENEWLCFSCQSVGDQHICCLCDTSGGALKVLEICHNEQEQTWVHLSCAFWSANITFNEKMTPQLKQTLKYDARCLICNKTAGVKLNCCWKNCRNRFHARCAMNGDQDMFVAENDDKCSMYLLALCCQHINKTDLSEKCLQKYKSLEKQQKRLEKFTSYVDLESIKKKTLILPDVLDSIHTYWMLKRQANNCQPLIDLQDDIYYHDYDQKVNLNDFIRYYHLEHKEETKNFHEKDTNMLSFLTTSPSVSPSSNHDNLFMKYARRNRIYLTGYERNRFCLLDGDKKKQEGLLKYLLSTK